MFGIKLGVNIKNKLPVWLGGMGLLMAVSCQWTPRQTEDCRILVRVGRDILCRKDIPPAVYRDLRGEDSAVAVRQYIDRWTTDHVFLYYARRNVDTIRINRLVREYRHSLLRDFYETELRSALSDTIRISHNELKDFYAQHKQNFPAEDTLIRWRYVIMNDSFKDRYKVMRWFRGGKPEDTEKIEEQYKNLLAVKLDSSQWIPFSEARKIMPFLQLRKPYGRKYPYRITKSRESRVYLVDIFDAVYPGDILPYDYIEPQLRMLLKQKKWKNSLQALRQKMRYEAEKQKIVKYE
jgi:hypothetical protein